MISKKAVPPPRGNGSDLSLRTKFLSVQYVALSSSPRSFVFEITCASGGARSHGHPTLVTSLTKYEHRQGNVGVEIFEIIDVFTTEADDFDISPILTTLTY